ncbi:MAG: carbohydrate-binding domain-containing protein [Corynebacterium glucuronolyticum]|nr:carbohydrate-binding domain-containing protein [Corynebacterium glucuronolyticum]
MRTDVFSVTVKAGDDALLGTDSVAISGGDLTLEANGDAVTSSKDDDEQKGWIRVTGGTLRAAAGDDALADTTDVLVEGARWSSPPRIRASMRGLCACRRRFGHRLRRRRWHSLRRRPPRQRRHCPHLCRRRLPEER